MIWAKSDIRTARKSELAPLLIERGYPNSARYIRHTAKIDG